MRIGLALGMGTKVPGIVAGPPPPPQILTMGGLPLTVSGINLTLGA